jgi:hypothetical protein
MAIVFAADGGHGSHPLRAEHGSESMMALPRLRFFLIVGVAVAVILAVHDLRRHPGNPTRAKEYGFLLYTTLVALLYGVVHDQLTATLSPEYFLLGKSLSADPAAFRWAVAKLGARASAGMGLLAGAALLVANGSGSSERFGYRELVRLSLVPLAFAVFFAVAFGAVNARLELGATTAREFVTDDRVRAFVVVWAIHLGSYVGALLGVVAAGGRVAWHRVRRR